MARPPRIDFTDAVYHVTSRGNGPAKIFWSDADRLRFLAQLADNVHAKQAQEFLGYDVLKEYGKQLAAAVPGLHACLKEKA